MVALGDISLDDCSGIHNNNTYYYNNGLVRSYICRMYTVKLVEDCSEHSLGRSYETNETPVRE